MAHKFVPTAATTSSMDRWEQIGIERRQARVATNPKNDIKDDEKNDIKDDKKNDVKDNTSTSDVKDDAVPSIDKHIGVWVTWAGRKLIEFEETTIEGIVANSEAALSNAKGEPVVVKTVNLDAIAATIANFYKTIDFSATYKANIQCGAPVVRAMYSSESSYWSSLIDAIEYIMMNLVAIFDQYDAIFPSGTKKLRQVWFETRRTFGSAKVAAMLREQS